MSEPSSKLCEPSSLRLSERDILRIHKFNESIGQDMPQTAVVRLALHFFLKVHEEKGAIGLLMKILDE